MLQYAFRLTCLPQWAIDLIHQLANKLVLAIPQYLAYIVVAFDRTHTIYVVFQSHEFYNVPWILIADATSFQAHAANYRNRTDQRSGRKQWIGVARGLKFVISAQGNDWVRFLYLAACISGFRRHLGLTDTLGLDLMLVSIRCQTR